jgi:hypothetical protein
MGSVLDGRHDGIDRRAVLVDQGADPIRETSPVATSRSGIVPGAVAAEAFFGAVHVAGV